MNKKVRFDVPIALFLFKRVTQPLLIIERLREIAPETIYLLSDGGRNEDEKIEVLNCRKLIEQEIDWSCKVVTRYLEVNKGVYENIANGAKWVLDQEEYAIFLEDDNLPELSFFWYCKYGLEEFKKHERVFWICGTNYLINYSRNTQDYFFTQNMLPCGWATWSCKFLKYYDGDMKGLNDPRVMEKIKKMYTYKKLFDQDFYNWNYEIEHFQKYGKYYSWDYQMAFTLRANNLLGIIPKYNQIKNIGVDNFSIHGGNNLENIMTARFCNLKTISLEFPLVGSKNVEIDHDLEYKLERMIVDNNFFSLKSMLSRLVRSILGINKVDSLKAYFINKLKRIEH